jgi:hypothetical protein
LGGYKGAINGLKTSAGKFMNKIKSMNPFAKKPPGTPTAAKKTPPKPTPPKPKPTAPEPKPKPKTFTKPTTPETAPELKPKAKTPEPKPKTTSPLRRDGSGLGKKPQTVAPKPKPAPSVQFGPGDAALKSPMDNVITETTDDIGKKTSQTLSDVSKQAEKAAAKKVSQEVADTGTKLVGEGIENAAKAGAAKGAATGLKLGAKTLPILGAGVSGYMAIKRFEEGDYFGSTLDAMSAIANASGPFTLGVGTALSLAIDAGHMYLDMSDTGNKIKSYINRLGADTEEMKIFAENVAKRTAELRKELDVVVPNLKSAEDVLSAANKAADAAGGNEYEDRTEVLRDDLLDGIKKHGSDVEAIYENLSSESKIAMAHLEDNMNTDYKQIIGNLLKSKKSVSYKSSASVGGGFMYTSPETKYRLNTQKGEELFEAANALGMQSAGAQLAEERKTAAML